MNKLDSKDKKIIKSLEENARASIKEIEKKTGIQRDSVNYRIKKLISQKVIKGFVPICDTNKLGYPVYTWMNIKLQQSDEELEQKFNSFLKGIPNILYIAKVTGAYHYVLTIATHDLQELDKIIKQIISKYPNMIKEYNSSLMIDEVQYDTFYRLI